METGFVFSAQLLRRKQDHRSSGDSVPKASLGVLRPRSREMGRQRPAIFWWASWFFLLFVPFIFLVSFTFFIFTLILLSFLICFIFVLLLSFSNFPFIFFFFLFDFLSLASFFFFLCLPLLLFLSSRIHYGQKQPRIQTVVLGNSLVHSLVRSHCSLNRSLAHFTHSLARGKVNY